MIGAIILWVLVGLIVTIYIRITNKEKMSLGGYIIWTLLIGQVLAILILPVCIIIFLDSIKF